MFDCLIAHQTRSAKNPPLNRPPNIIPHGACTWKLPSNQTNKQSKNCTVTHKFLHLPKNYYVYQMIAVKKCHSILLFGHFTFNSWLGFPRTSFHIVKVLAWLRFSKIYVLMASFTAGFSKFPSNYKLVQSILRRNWAYPILERKFPSVISPSKRVLLFERIRLPEAYFWNPFF